MEINFIKNIIKLCIVICIVICIIIILKYDSIEHYDNKNKEIPLYYINLKESKDRNLDMIAELKKQNYYNYNREDGINYNEYKPSNYEKSILKSPKFKNKNGSIGCALAHYKLWKKIVNNDEDIFLVCEDDIKFVDKFKIKLFALINQMKKDNYDVIFLCNNLDEYKNNTDYKIIHYNKLYWFGAGTQSYLINKKALHLLLNTIKENGIYKEIDWFMYNQFNKLKIGFINISLVIQLFKKSDLKTLNNDN